jgi:hypothetical protein
MRLSWNVKAFLRDGGYFFSGRFKRSVFGGGQRLNPTIRMLVDTLRRDQ